ncbi:helix-turn-helix transcriptional regulator [Murimonas intestini]|uniref:AraC-like DNA-binding protein n=1 Tax=Murimonas intestini TaxID=1337051 RepID=A0AB73T6F4_9FIRM|nr:AraC family transcriptional regulator [Murimonas intestini]MCR1841927.1 AraC family transcriptional regulator [Murimonas intestini]MCR1864997.1 AraC family transcriptional regulator [Murimonas intestini]MCR1885694.1 AraC family transcriptional regulator [Murimonas intestini]
MNVSEKLSVYLELINCNYDLYVWEYNDKLQFLHTNWTQSIFSGNFLSYTGLAPLVDEHISSGLRTPLILEAPANLLWIAGFYYEGPLLVKCYFIGPIYSGRDSHLLLRKHMDSYELSVKLRSMITKIFEQIPTIPGNILSQYAVMLHYCLTGEKISSNDLTYQSTVPTARKTFPQSASLEHAGIWYSEQQLCKMLADGDPRYKEALAKSASLSSGLHAETGDSLRQHKNNSLVLLTLCSRACIQGGLTPSISYDLNDYYAARLEECTSLTEVQKLSETMLADYVYRVQQAKKDSHISSQVQNTCAYIKANITTPLSIKTLAEKYGYSEYYFSHKFKKELGISINDFILNEKIEQAKLLLSGTNDNIQTISDNLLFGNRSYFYACFQKQTGMSPSEYRAQNTKL